MWKRPGIILLLLNMHCVDMKLLVTTKGGTIQGLQAGDGDYAMFLGIPYAQVNSSNPFGASIPHPKFDKILEAFDDSVICPQLEEYTKEYVGTVDCLRLNIFVPNTKTENRAVLFYIYGGYFRQGYSSRSRYGPKYLVRHDVVIVIINYRIGPYGFMCTDTPEIPGNQGLKDQYTAMKWVKENIRAFGGDPNKITIMGYSSGSMCVDFHLLTKVPRLYHQAILHSGPATSPNVLNPSDRMATVKIANKLGFYTTDPSAAIAFLAKTNPVAVIKASLSTEFKPCIEKKFDGVLSYVTEHPENSNAHNVDGTNIIGGFTYREALYGIYGAHSSFKDKFDNPDLIRDDLNTVFDFPNTDEIAKIVKHFYFGDGPSDRSNKYKLIEFVSNYHFNHPLQRAFVKYSKHKNTNVYQYLFSYDGGRNFYKTVHNVTESGATHGDDLGYLFDTIFIKGEPNEEDAAMIDILTTLWTNFIKHGNPTPNVTNLIPITWPPLRRDAVSCLQIDKRLEVVSRPFQANLAFWDLMFQAYGDRMRAKLTPVQKSSANVIYFYNNISLIYIIFYVFLFYQWN